MTLSLCPSVTLSTINGLISLPTFIRFGQNFFAPIWAEKNVSKKIIDRGPVWPGLGAKKTVVCQAILAISQDIGLKIET